MNEDRDHSTPDLSGILSQISSNPKALSMLSTLLGNMGNAHQKAETEARAEPSDAALTVLQPPKRCGFEERKRLLLALKPFLPPERCQTVDLLLMVVEAFSALRQGKRD